MMECLTNDIYDAALKVIKEVQSSAVTNCWKLIFMSKCQLHTDAACGLAVSEMCWP